MSMLKQPLLKHLEKRIDQGISPLRWIDLYSAQYVADCHLTEHTNEESRNQIQQDIVILALMVSFVSSKGQTYLTLDNLPKDILPTYQFQSGDFSDWLSKLSDSSAIRRVHHDGLHPFPLEQDSEHQLEQTPLILWKNRLYLARYWRLYQKLESWLHSKSVIGQAMDEVHLESMAKQLKAVFNLNQSSQVIDNSEETGEALNWQAISAGHTLLQNFSLITGGPGTGKTTTAASLLYLLMQRQK